MQPQRYAFGAFVFDVDRELVTRDGRPLVVSARGLALLRALLMAEGKTVSKSALMDAAWPGIAVEESNLSVQIAILRRLLGPAADGSAWIATVPRVGYRFSGDLAVAPAISGADEATHHSRTSSICSAESRAVVVASTSPAK